jgi:hypothetical protein
MQIWVFFQSGAGGDGFTNLLEQSKNIKSIDGEYGYWRIHRIVDNQIKFYAPTIDQKHCFRSNLPFKQNGNSLHPTYLDIITKQENCVVASHDIDLSLLYSSDQLDILTSNQIKIALICTDTKTLTQNAAIKNLQPKVFPTKFFKPDPDNFDFIVDIKDVHHNWDYVACLCDKIGIKLDYEKYHEYKSLLQGQKTYMTENYNIEIYQTYTKNNIICYDLIDVYNPTVKDINKL